MASDNRDMDSLVDSLLEGVKRSGLMDPKTAQGMEFWKRDEMNTMWDNFDAKSYALFLVYGQLFKGVNYSDSISASLSRRARGDEALFNKFATEVMSAQKDVLGDFQRIYEQHKNVELKTHTFGTNSMQVRWVAPGS